jgi:hypothetical protein
MLKRRYIPWLLGAALFMSLPTRTGRVLAQGAICGTFTDVQASSVFCPYILEAFISSITQGSSPTTFNPSDPVPREQAVTFLTRTMDQTLHRGSIRTVIGKAWSPTSINSGIAMDIGGSANDVVTDGTYLWFARGDGKVQAVAAANRRLDSGNWSLVSGVPKKLGIFAGLVWIADEQGRLHNFNPTGLPGTATLVTNISGISAGNPTLAFDGSNVWFATSSGNKVAINPVSGPGGFTFSPSTSSTANIDGLVFDGTNMWVLTGDSHLLKMTIPTPGAAVPAVAETIALPGVVSDCRMLYDGNNIWIPIGTTGTLYVIRPTLNQVSLPSSIVKNEAIPDVGSPYVASFDGENVMIGGLTNGFLALYKATNLARIRTFNSGVGGVRGIASDGRTFNIGDIFGTKFYQY